MGARDYVERLRARPENLGMLANDQLATAIVTRLCRPETTFVDVGAHIGSIVAEVQHRCRGVKIIAIEAMPDKADRLKSKFKDIEVHCCALAEDDGEVSFFVNTQHSGYSSLADNGGTEISVRKRPLDDIAQAEDVDVVKIDVEGAELGVLIGGERMIARNRPTIMFESGPQESLGYTKVAMFDWFAERDYGIFVPNRLAHTAPPLSKEGFLDSHHYPRRTTNYFAVASERVPEIRERARSL